MANACIAEDNFPSHPACSPCLTPGEIHRLLAASPRSAATRITPGCASVVLLAEPPQPLKWYAPTKNCPGCGSFGVPEHAQQCSECLRWGQVLPAAQRLARVS